MYDDDDDEPLKIRIHQKKMVEIFFFTAVFTSLQNIRIV